MNHQNNLNAMQYNQQQDDRFQFIIQNPQNQMECIKPVQYPNLYQPSQDIEMINYNGNFNSNVPLQNTCPLLPTNVQQYYSNKDIRQLILDITLIFIIWSGLTLYLEFKLAQYFEDYNTFEYLPIYLIALYLISLTATKKFAQKVIPSISIFCAIAFLTALILISVVKCFPDERDPYNDGFQLTLQGFAILLVVVQTILNGIATLIIYIILLCESEIIRFQSKHYLFLGIAIILLIFSGVVLFLFVGSFLSIVIMLIYSFSLLSSLRRIYNAKKMLSSKIAAANITYLGIILPFQFE